MAARTTHKYIKRTGTPGSYKYFYVSRRGEYVPSDHPDSPVTTDEAKIEHVKRLLLGRTEGGHHSKTFKQIADMVGVTPKRVKQISSNLFQKTIPRNVAAGRPRHQFSPSEIVQAHLESELHDASVAERAATPAPAPAPAPILARDEVAERTLREHGTIAPPAVDPELAELEPVVEAIRQRVAKRNQAQSVAPAPSPEDAEKKRLRKLLAEQYGLAQFAEAPQPQPEPELVIEEPVSPPMTDRARGAAARAGRAAEQDALARSVGFERVGTSNVFTSATTGMKIIESNAEDDIWTITWPNGTIVGGFGSMGAAIDHIRVVDSPSPSSPAAAAVHSVDSELAVADAPIARMEATAAAGGNPHLQRAKEIYQRIRNDVSPARRAIVDHVLAAIDHLELMRNVGMVGGENAAEGILLDRYKQISGKRIRGLSGIAAEFEKATFKTLDEVLHNRPVSAEVERMKTGYGAMQYARMAPYVNDEYKAKLRSMGRSGPPPYPTYKDLKTWGSTPIPESMRASRIQRQVPQAFYDSVPKDAQGKPQMPPAWMPLNMMPAWIYHVKKSMKAGASAYEGGTLSPSPNELTAEGVPTFPSQGNLNHQFRNTVRKYIQMRGEGNLVDIPVSSLAEANISHHDIYKSKEGMSFEEIVVNKIIDPVSLVSFMESQPKPVKKSFALVVDLGLDAVDFKKSFYVAQKPSKAELINKIKSLRSGALKK
jgi:hypothetical protein